MVYCRVSNNVIKEANNHQTMMQSQSLTCNAGVFWTGEICLFMFVYVWHFCEQINHLRARQKHPHSRLS